MEHGKESAFHRIAGPVARSADRVDASDELIILVVDDDDDMRSIVCRMLKRMKVNHVIEAQSGQQALEWLTTAPATVSMVICDWNMPGMSGMDLFKQVHTSKPNLPFLLLTGRADLQSVVAAKKAGVHGYLAKPVSPQDLHAKVTSLIGRSAPLT
jgi:DNA-binding NtrC family response regulator